MWWKVNEGSAVQAILSFGCTRAAGSSSDTSNDKVLLSVRNRHAPTPIVRPSAQRTSRLCEVGSLSPSLRSRSCRCEVESLSLSLRSRSRPCEVGSLSPSLRSSPRPCEVGSLSPSLRRSPRSCEVGSLSPFLRRGVRSGACLPPSEVHPDYARLGT